MTFRNNMRTHYTKINGDFMVTVWSLNYSYEKPCITFRYLKSLTKKKLNKIFLNPKKLEYFCYFDK